MTINAPAISFRGEWKLRVLDPEGNVKHETDWFKNLVTNTGLDLIGNGSVIGAFCRIGTGNTTPAYSDSALVSQSASTSSVVATTLTNAGTPNYETVTTSTYQFALGAVVGNMAEIGIGTTASTASTLCTRALIVDGGGSPTTITVLVSEILQAVYRFTVFPNLVDASGTVTIQGVSYNYTSRQIAVSTALTCNPSQYPLMGSVFVKQVYNGAIVAYTATNPTGSAASWGTAVASAYTNGNYYRDFTFTAGLTEANVTTGISAMLFGIGGSGVVFQTQISFAATAGGAPIPKDGTKQLTMVLRQYWSHH